jgi:apolipoprotein N-acyltransferase
LSPFNQPYGSRFDLRALPVLILLSEGWSRRLFAFFAGATGALALAPFSITPAIMVPLCVAVWLIDGEPSARAAAGAGWWLGFGYFLAGLWWLGAALLVEADQFAWALPIAVIGLPAVLAIFTAAGFGLARLLWSPGPARVFALAAGLGGAEWLRGHMLTGFPWNNVGMALADAGPLAQSAALVGLYGLDLLAVVIFASPATLIDADSRRLSRNPAIILAVALLVFMTAYGSLRLAASPPQTVAGVKLRLMQPNLPQDAKFRPENGPEILRRYLALSDLATSPEHSGMGNITHLIWPESAFPFILSRQPEALAAISGMLKDAVLITGAARVESPEGENGKIFNSIEVLQGDRIIAFFDKIHLVPFGEYLPLAPILGRLGFAHLVPGVWDAGEGPRELRAPGLPLLSPLICYEAVFPEAAAARGVGRKRPGALLNLTNDGWFGRTIGPYQHFAQARLRAIEQGLPLIRVANTGISAIVDPYGRVLDRLPLGEEGVIDGLLPKPAAMPFYARFGRIIPATLFVLALTIALAGRIFHGKFSQIIDFR